MLLFQTDVEHLLLERERRIRREIDLLPATALLGNSEHLALDIAKSHEFRDVPTLLRDEAYAEETAFEPGRDHCRVPIHIPFSGDPLHFELGFSEHPVDQRNYEVGTRTVSRIHQIRCDQISKLPVAIDDDVRYLNLWLQKLKDRIDLLNTRLLRTTKSLIEERTRQIGEAQRASEALREIIPMRRRTDEASTVVLPVSRKPLPVCSPSRHGGPLECAIEMSAYEEILSTITAMARVMERSPSVFTRMDEESLRTVLLVALNGLFEGQATGETFNGFGRTDILIRVHDKNLFIAECLIWDGSSHLIKKMNEQLFQYAMWRDIRTALIVVLVNPIHRRKA